MDRLINLRALIKKIKHREREEKKRLHNLFVQEHKKMLICLDVVVCLIVCMNFGALAITNVMVSEKDWGEAKAQNTTVEYIEVNPTASAVYDFQGPETQQEKKAANTFLIQFFKLAFFWTILLFFYVYYRRTLFTEKELYLLILIVLWYFIVLGSDFWRDYGFWLAKVIYGP